jgi:hypothetical protein
MADPDFQLSEFGKQTKVILDCIESATDQKPFNRKAARDAIKALGDMLGPGEAATDTDPTLAEQERKLKGGPVQEKATGDKRTASDSRYDTRFSVAEIFNGKHDSEGTSVGAPSFSEIFGGSTPHLGEG